MNEKSKFVISIIVSAVTYAAISIAFRAMSPNLLGAIIGITISGVITGIIPLMLGKKKGYSKLGWIGFVSCLVGSIILGIILALPICIIFSMFICIKPKRATPQPLRKENPDDTGK